MRGLFSEICRNLCVWTCGIFHQIDGCFYWEYDDKPWQTIPFQGKYPMFKLTQLNIIYSHQKFLGLQLNMDAGPGEVLCSLHCSQPLEVICSIQHVLSELQHSSGRPLFDHGFCKWILSAIEVDGNWGSRMNIARSTQMESAPTGLLLKLRGIPTPNPLWIAMCPMSDSIDKPIRAGYSPIYVNSLAKSEPRPIHKLFYKPVKV